MTLSQLLGVSLPIIQAPMAGVQGHALAVAVSNADGLGSLPCATLGLDALRAELAAIRAGTVRPYNVNFFCHAQPEPDPAREATWRKALAPYFEEYGIDPDTIPPGAGRVPFSREAADVLAEFRPPVVSFHFGLPPEDLLACVRGWGAKILSSATTVDEARWLEARGVDAVIAQGLEAGGHRGHFLSDDLDAQPGTFALVPQIVRAVRVPVVAAGGIADARGVAAALALGAAGVQVGTAYLLCPEATTGAAHRAALCSEAGRMTALTNLFTGRPARGIVNRLMRELGAMSAAAPAFPLAAAALAPLRAGAEKRGRGDFSPLWAGQNTSGCRGSPGGDPDAGIGGGHRRGPLGCRGKIHWSMAGIRLKWLARTLKKTTQFKQLLRSPELEFLLEAHNGLSARIVEETGFRGIWASGLSISAALGVRDNNEASWTQVLEVVEFMADATQIPILLDGDTGYGNFNNMRRLVHKLEQRGVAAVCIEDKLFPKTNSFIQSEQQPLADAGEFAGKVAAVKDAQDDPDFCVVARLEAFIAGWGLKEMLRRADLYAAAGADALLVHSKRATPEQILAFAAEWRGHPCPLVVVPTTFYSTPTETFARAGVSLAIWANHNVRSAITAMQRTSRRIFEDRSVLDVEDGIAPVREVFRLQNADELLAAEERYLPKHPQTRALILAASRGSELGEVTAARPKAMVPVGGVPLLHKLVAQLHAAAVKDVVVVRGFGKEQVHAPDVRFIDNDDFADTGELVTLGKAAAELSGELVISFGDILFRRYILSNLLDEPGDIVLAVDAAWQQRPAPGGHVDYVACSRPYSLQYGEQETRLAAMGPDLPREEICGEWIGLVKTTARGSETLRRTLAQMAREPGFARGRLDDLFRRLLADGVPVSVLYITGHWLDVDNLDDLAQAQAF